MNRGFRIASYHILPAACCLLISDFKFLTSNFYFLAKETYNGV